MAQQRSRRQNDLKITIQDDALRTRLKASEKPAEEQAYRISKDANQSGLLSRARQQWRSRRRHVKQPSKDTAISALNRAYGMRQLSVSLALMVVLVGIPVVLTQRIADNGPQQSTAIGSNNGTNVSIQRDEAAETALPQEVPDFPLYYPDGVEPEVVRVSPEDADPAYVYVHESNGSLLQVTQQQLAAIDRPIADIAAEFNASTTIVVDEQEIFTGFNERSNVRSVLFQKDDILFLISGDRSLTEDTIVSFYLSLNRDE